MRSFPFIRRALVWVPAAKVVSRHVQIGLAGAAALCAATALAIPGSAQADVPETLYGFAGVKSKASIAPGTAASLIAGIGGNASRTSIHWQELETEQDVWVEEAFQRYRVLYDAMRARGITPTFVLQYAPAWAREEGAPQACPNGDLCHYPPAPAMHGEWQEFVAEIATRFPAAALEIWNEPNYKGQWQSGVDPSAYAQLLAEADEAAAGVDPSIPVFMGGLGTSAAPEGIEAEEFLAEAYAAPASLRDHSDAVNLHLYPGLGYATPGSLFEQTIEMTREIREQFDDGGKPLLISELGASTTGPSRFTAAQQADLVIGASRKLLAMPDVRGVLIYTLADRPEKAIDDPERGFGLVADTGLVSLLSAKPAYCGLASASGLALPILRRLPLVGCLFSGPEPEPEPEPKPEPVPAGTLSLRVAKGHSALVPGARPRRFVVHTTAAGGDVPAVRVCAPAAGAIRVVGRRCVPLGALRPGALAPAAFRLKLRAPAPRRVDVVFTAQGGSATATTAHPVRVLKDRRPARTGPA